MNAICIFCGSSLGNSERFAAGARAVAKSLARRGITIVYGGASSGLMGIVADTALTHGGRVIGVMPKSLLGLEIEHDGLAEFHVTEDIPSRKTKMAELSDGFIALPGGLGTLEEFAEVISGAQLGFHEKPCGLLDTDGYYQPLLRFLDGGVTSKFIRPEGRALVIADDDPDRLVAELMAKS